MTQTIVERIAEYHRTLFEQAEYRRHVVAKTDAQTVEGSLAFDTIVAAGMIREAALAAGDADIPLLKLAPISTILAEMLGRSQAMAAAEQEAQAVRLVLHGLPPHRPQ